MATRAGEERIAMPTLEGELRRLREAAERLGATGEEAAIQEAILGISIYFKQLLDSHSSELAQLRDEIRILHGLMREPGREDSNAWRLQLLRRAEIEARIRTRLDEAAPGRAAECVTVCVPIPSPLASRAGSPEIAGFLRELGGARGGEGADIAGVWASNLAVVWKSAPSPAGGNRLTLPETVRVNETNYVIRARSWEVIAAPGERPEAYLKRIGQDRAVPGKKSRGRHAS